MPPSGPPRTGWPRSRRRLLCLCLVLALFSPGAAVQADYRDRVLSHNPIAYWRLGETSGSVAWDETANYDGTYYGPLLDQPGAIASNPAAAFDGVDDYVDVGTPAISGSAITLVGWLKSDDFAAPAARVISKRKPWVVLMVANDPANLTAQDSARKSLIESWGYQVNLLATAAPLAELEAAVAAADAAYIPAAVAASSLDSARRNMAIGVVNERGALIDPFGFAGSIQYKGRTSIRILNNPHYITSGYAAGSTVTILDTSQSLTLLDSNYAAGLVQLTETFNVGNGYKPSLAVVNTGGSLHGGGTAADRRVTLPWGAADFDINTLNVEGRTILQRSLAWAAARDAADAEIQRHHWTLGTTTSGGNSYLNVLLKTGDTTVSLTASSEPLPSEEWIFAAAVYDGSSLKLYQNAVEVASMSLSGTLAAGSGVPVWIGDQPEAAAGNGQGSPFQGLLDEIAIFDQALDPEQLLELHAAALRRGVRVLKWMEVK